MATGSGSARFYAGLNTNVQQNSPLPLRDGMRLNHAEMLNLISQQQDATKELQRQNAELQRQNTALLLITTNIDKEIKALKEDTASIRTDVRSSRGSASGRENGPSTSRKLPAALKVHK